MKLIIFGLIVIIASSAFGQLPLPGNGCAGFCQNNVTYSLKDTEGIWYQTHNVPHAFVEGSRCVYANITNIDETTQSLELVETRPDGSRRITQGSLHYVNGSINVLYTNLALPFDGSFFAVPPSYIAIVFCHDCGLYSKDGSGVYVSLFSRLAFPKCEDAKKVVSLIEFCGVSLDAIPEVDQSNCLSTC